MIAPAGNVIAGPFPAELAPERGFPELVDDARPVHQTDDGKVPAELARGIARKFVDFLTPCCERIAIAGSLRRRRALVSDIEILFIPKIERVLDPSDLFKERSIATPATDRALKVLIALGILAKRPNVNGSFSWGEKNKLGVHPDTGIAIDLFTATQENWFNYLVCRTGGAENNVRIAAAARAMGWKWNPYGSGFTSLTSINKRVVASEREVFGFVGLPYLEPWER